jgi:hypothetical protein
MTPHLVDHRLNVLVFAELGRLLRESNVLAASTEIDERGQQLRRWRAKDCIERWAQVGLFDPAFEMKKDLDDAMNESQKHRKSTADWIAAWARVLMLWRRNLKICASARTLAQPGANPKFSRG